ncbi:MAG: hypothetical protein HY481_02075 [Candidatus Vogelbacteria bacterium]|nr:hypothetical protein [Candidatus Vogelbacteria bacterium]
MRIIKRLAVLFSLGLIVTSSALAASVSDLKQKFDDYYVRQYPGGIARTLSSSYFSEPYLAGLLSMYETTQNTFYLEEALKGVENLISLLRDVDGDSYLEWIEGVATGIALQDHDGNPATARRYSCLDTERGVRQFARLARIIKNDGPLNATYGARADAVIRIIEHDIIQHPYCRDRYTAAFTNGDAPVYHIISHGALILDELYLAIGNQNYLNIATAKATLLKNNLKRQPDDSQALAWGTTFCRELKYTYPDCYYVKTNNPAAHPVCKDSSQGYPYCSPADTSHAENFVFAAIELYRSGAVFTREDINALAYTFLAKVWDGNATDPRYRDFIDGNLEPADAINEGGYGQWWMGSNTAPGWVGLGAFNDKISSIQIAGDSSSITNKANPLAYYGELARNLVAKDCQYTNRASEIADGLDNDCDGVVDEGMADTTPPTVPTGLIISDVTDSAITLNWDPSTDPVVSGQTTAGVAGYKVYRNGAATPIATVTATNYQDTGLTANTAYTYQVSAIDGAVPANESAKSASVSATTQSAPPPTCIESWSCPAWSVCASGTQTRTCMDLNSCGTTVDKPSTAQTCPLAPAPPAIANVPVEPPAADVVQITALKARLVELLKILITLLKQKLNQLLILRGLR